LEPHSIRIVLAFIMLAIASIQDLWKREIHDFVWLVFGAIAVIMVFFEPDFLSMLYTIGFSLIVAPLALVVWRIGFFGGADALALIVLAALAPQFTLSEGIVTPFSTLLNAALLSLTPICVNVLRNVIALSKGEKLFEGFKETSIRKIAGICLGYRAKNPKFSFSIERKEGDHKKLDLAIHNAETAEFCTKPNTWVTPGTPYILFIAGGFIIQIFFGDIIFNSFRIIP